MPAVLAASTDLRFSKNSDTFAATVSLLGLEIDWSVEGTERNYQSGVASTAGWFVTRAGLLPLAFIT